MIVDVNYCDKELGKDGVDGVSDTNGEIVLFLKFPVKLFGEENVTVISTNVELITIVSSWIKLKNDFKNSITFNSTKLNSCCRNVMQNFQL